MGEVVSILKNQPHIEGRVKCLACKHEWIVVAPVGKFDGFECPKCGLYKGVFMGTCSPEVAWTCNCGCNIFMLSPEGIICINCGEYQTWEPIDE